jgi:succinoglycan biosynthesis protein ExoM
MAFSNSDHICVCICTYKRPDLLCTLLEKLQNQKTDSLFTYSAVVVDNDANKTAQTTVENIRKTSAIRIDYYNEPEQNIALTRNRAVENAQGNYIAFIDDDEFPVSDWLLNLYKTMHLFNADAVLGPVRPYYLENTPKWLIKSKLCERPEHKTGTVMHWGSTRTGNVLLVKQMFEDPNNRFGREFGRTGGEDIEFFKKMAEKGKQFVWCNEAPAYETVLPERWNKEFYKQRFLRIGGLVGEKIRTRESIVQGAYSLTKSAGWIIAMSIALPFARVASDHLYMKAVTKIVYNTGFISGFMGRVIIRNRDE